MSGQLNEPIAIVGSACRFAGDATSPSKLWELLREPRHVGSKIPDTRFSADGFYHPDHAHHGRSNVRDAYLINEDLGLFDAEFFGIKPIEASAVDPQQRVLMEVIYEGLEAAGLPVDGLRGSDTAVYVGVMTNDYEALLLRDMYTAPTYFATGVGRSILSNRVSYFFDWHGPSITMDTACSSSIVSIHMALQALRSGDSKVAVACGSNLILGPENFIVESKLKMLSPNGTSRMWDRDADGYARGEGVAAVILKPLSAALKDGDHIECIIRETGINQDGATRGITMPSASAQQALIESTYAKAGLNLASAEDRPQFFEAHGTGTPAGDPIEAEAISSAFFGSGKTSTTQHDKLYVGSIKTVLGHTEGTAGVAAVLKASLALQHESIPPNLLFDNLSETVAPFYKRLEIATSATPWPKLPGASTTLRASVNSFGFGGLNGHCILEKFSGSSFAAPQGQETNFTPVVFSAMSERSLRATLERYAAFLKSNSSINYQDLAYTLRQRRSIFPFRAAFTAGSIEELAAHIDAKLSDKDSTVGVRALQLNDSSRPKILGVFTGQGAQYARMGAELIEKSPAAKRVVKELESHLASLPADERPTWSLEAELLAEPKKSRVGQAALSQPLCTAVQIMLVDLLRLANVQLDGVVGHSSGEIGAAYAAGFLTARDAIIVAYYRGVHLAAAASPNGKDIVGAMIAVGTSMADATQICELDEFQGRLALAACNSSSSVTISGDEDAIFELQAMLNDENKFNRVLRVDRAYHSAHMLPCFDAYVDSLRRCGVKAQQPENHGCVWVSSVDGEPVSLAARLSDTYWAENMTKPVLFSQALSSIVSTSSYDLAIEIGAHPALKGPATQTMQEILNTDIPYTGLLSRQTEADKAMSTGLGFSWQHLSTSNIDLDAFERAATGLTGASTPYRVLKGLPSYAWNHETRYWHESRRSRKMRLRKNPVGNLALLGDESSESGPNRRSWKNLLRTKELEWLPGHQVQGQTVLPASAYVCTAIEAIRCIAGLESIRLVDIRDFVIHQAVVFEQGDAGVEALTTLDDIQRPSPDRIQARFTYSAATNMQSDDLFLAASGTIEALLGQTSATILPERAPRPAHLISVDPERFYQALADLGYDFSGRFRSLATMRRNHHKAVAETKMMPRGEGDNTLLIHPAELDAAFQAVILAYSYPQDDQLRSLHLPTQIGHIRLNPALCMSNRTEVELAPVDANITPRTFGEEGFSGDCTLYTNDGLHAAIQVQAVKLKPVGGSSADDDRQVFSRLDWLNRSPDAQAAAVDTVVSQEDRDVLEALERISVYYLTQFDRQVRADDPIRSERPFSCYLEYASHIVRLVQSGQHKWAKQDWLKDSLEDVLAATSKYNDLVDVKMMHLVGKTMPKAFKKQSSMLEEFRLSNLLGEYYETGFGLQQSSMWISRAVSQLTDLYPHMNMLEIGAGTGGATKNIFRTIGSNYRSYTFTDISAAFFEEARSIFVEQEDHIIFKTLDAERDVVDQGFVEGTYDLIVANFVLHATAELERTMRNVRKLLRPGGFLVVGESSIQCDHGCFIFGPLPGWWLGYDEGRKLYPNVSPGEWNRILKANGFSGIDAIAGPEFLDVLGVSPFVSQAVDDHVNLLRTPLSDVPHPVAQLIPKLVLIGGKTARSASILEQTKVILSNFAESTSVFSQVDDIDFSIVDEDSTVVSLTDLDTPVFKDMTPTTFEAFRRLFESKKTILWVTSGRIGSEPWSNIVVGFGRTAENEAPELKIQHLDLPEPSTAEPSVIAETLLRLHHQVAHQQDIMWAPEPEIILDKEGHFLVPRLRPLAIPNARYNSGRRLVTAQTTVAASPVAINHSENGRITVQSIWRDHAGSKEEGVPVVELDLTHSLLSAVPTPLGNHFLGVGKPRGSSNKARYLVLLSTIVSAPTIPLARTVCLEGKLLAGLSTETLLSLAGAYLVATAIVSPLFCGQTAVVLNPSPAIALAVSVLAAAKGVETVFVTDASEAHPSGWLYISPYASKKDIFNALPKHISSITDLTASPSEVGRVLFAGQKDHIRKNTVETLFSHSGVDSGAQSAAVLTALLKGCVDYIQQSSQDALSSISSALTQLTLPQIAQDGHVDSGDPLAVLDLTSSEPVPVNFTRIDSKPMFKGDKTYWMVGLSGALGISLCDWIIDRGARTLVLSSRTPKIDPAWIEAHKRNGVRIIILPCDATVRPALEAVHKTIRETLPPIAGVLNGAMVLRDMSVRNMTYDQLMDVVRPKALGSVHLDAMFFSDPLDFFILFSSINCIIGSTGQANYAGANTFMCSVAAQRRKRGLAATAINVGAIIGAGYMERESSKTLDLTVSRNALMKFSEEDFHQLFAEGVEAGQPDSPNGPELSTGLLHVASDGPTPPRWISDPKFSYFVTHRKSTDADKGEKTDNASIHELLEACHSPEDVQAVVKQAFANQLRNELRMTTPDDELMRMRSNDIGLDSLISVDIRTWFLKHFSVSIPVLKILSNDTMANLVQIAVENIPPEMVPNVDSGSSTPVTSDSSASTSARPSSTNASTPVANAVDDASKQIDWDAQCSLPDDLDALAQPQPDQAPVYNPPKTVVLTGAAGLLGHHLLSHFLAQPSVQKVHCIGLRQLPEKIASGALPRNDARVTYYEGDLTLPRLGLSPTDAQAIFSTADMVVHNGADTSHTKTFASVRASNVGSTQELVRLALARRIPLHYVSSPGAALFANEAVLRPCAPAAGSYPPADGSHGYISSKWACERFLQQVNRQFGLRVWIHRPSTIVREGLDAQGATAQRDWVNGFLQYVRVTKKAPRLLHNKGALDLVYVKNVCEELVRAAIEEGDGSGIDWCHEVGDMVIPLQEVHLIDEKKEGKVYELVPVTEWMAAAVKAGMHAGIAALVEDMDAQPDYPRLQKGRS